MLIHSIIYHTDFSSGMPDGCALAHMELLRQDIFSKGKNLTVFLD